MPPLAIAGAKNIVASVDAARPSVVQLRMDLTQSLGPSSSGKTVLIATTAGNRALGASGASVGVNLYSKPGTKVDVSAASNGKKTDVGLGVTWWINGDVLVVEFETNPTEPVSSGSGKTTLLASTQGNRALEKTGVVLAVNCYCPAGQSINVAGLQEVPSQCGDVRFDLSDATNIVLRVPCAETAKGGKLTSGAGYRPLAATGLSLQLVFVVDAPPTTTVGAGALAPVPNGRNLRYKWEDRCLVLVVDRTVEGSLSASKKSVLLASTAGARLIPGGKLTVNLIGPAPPGGSDGNNDAAVVEPEAEEEAPTIEADKVREAAQAYFEGKSLKEAAASTIRQVREFVEAQVGGPVDGALKDVLKAEIAAVMKKHQTAKRSRDD